jgi:hypothetical protein
VAPWASKTNLRPNTPATPPPDDELGHDGEYDVENWQDCESEDEDDHLSKEQEDGGFFMIGKLVKDKKVKTGCVPLPF